MSKFLISFFLFYFLFFFPAGSISATGLGFNWSSNFSACTMNAFIVNNTGCPGWMDLYGTGNSALVVMSENVAVATSSWAGSGSFRAPVGSWTNAPATFIVEIVLHKTGFHTFEFRSPGMGELFVVGHHSRGSVLRLGGHILQSAPAWDGTSQVKTIQVEIDPARNRLRANVANHFPWTEWVNFPFGNLLNSTDLGFMMSGGSSVRSVSVSSETTVPVSPLFQTRTSIRDIGLLYREFINGNWNVGYFFRANNTLDGRYNSLRGRVINRVTGAVHHTFTTSLENPVLGTNILVQGIRYHMYSVPTGSYRIEWTFCDTKTASCDARVHNYFFELNQELLQRTRAQWEQERFAQEQKQEELSWSAQYIRDIIDDVSTGIFSRFPFNWGFEIWNIIRRESARPGTIVFPSAVINVPYRGQTITANLFNIEGVMQTPGLAQQIAFFRSVFGFALWLGFIFVYFRQVESIINTLKR